MTHLDSSPSMVAAVRTSMSLPIVLLALPAGALADRIDRRKLLWWTQACLLMVTLALAACVKAEWISAWGLLAGTFLIGLGMVLHIPTWQASIPDLVPRNQLSRAIALGSLSFNLARAVGPAAGGMLISFSGVWAAFAVNAISFAGVMSVLTVWRREPTESTRGMSFSKSIWHGLRYVGSSPSLRRVLLGVLLFVFPASVMWSLLPLIVSEQLGWQAGGFGFLYTMVGLGAVAAASILPRVVDRFGRDATVVGAMLGYAVGLMGLAHARSTLGVIPVTLLLGACWMMTLTSLNTRAQLALPKRMKARGMGCYLSTLALSMAIGSLTWGFLAEQSNLASAIMTAAVTMIATAACSWFFRLKIQAKDS